MEYDSVDSSTGTSPPTPTPVAVRLGDKARFKLLDSGTEHVIVLLYTCIYTRRSRHSLLQLDDEEEDHIKVAILGPHSGVDGGEDRRRVSVKLRRITSGVGEGNESPSSAATIAEGEFRPKEVGKL